MNDVINRKDAIGAILSVGHIAELSDGDAVIRVSAVNYVLRNLPSAQPEPTDISAKEAVYNLAEKIGIHQLFALTVELRGEPIQLEPSIPLSWVEKYIEWLKRFDNEFANLEAAHISVMVKKWRDEQNETARVD